MIGKYYDLLKFSILGTISLFAVNVLVLIFRKKILNKKYGILLFILCMAFCFRLLCGMAGILYDCCIDYHYVSSNTYEEAQATVVGFNYTTKHSDGNGEIENSQPIFHLIEGNKTVVLYASDVELNETYLIRYYPNTKICEVIEHITP